LSGRSNLKPEEAAFVGDDVIDLSARRAGGLAIAVKNTPSEVKNEATTSRPRPQETAPSATLSNSS
jgi:3-deoxy-D-manno-octulosonate 8-phosphate phosphatase KdsC-like HAD superfamily phosphatase